MVRATRSNGQKQQGDGPSFKNAGTTGIASITASIAGFVPDTLGKDKDNKSNKESGQNVMTTTDEQQNNKKKDEVKVDGPTAPTGPEGAAIEAYLPEEDAKLLAQVTPHIKKCITPIFEMYKDKNLHSVSDAVWLKVFMPAVTDSINGEEKDFAIFSRPSGKAKVEEIVVAYISSDEFAKDLLTFTGDKSSDDIEAALPVDESGLPQVSTVEEIAEIGAKPESLTLMEQVAPTLIKAFSAMGIEPNKILSKIHSMTNTEFEKHVVEKSIEQFMPSLTSEMSMKDAAIPDKAKELMMQAVTVIIEDTLLPSMLKERGNIYKALELSPAKLSADQVEEIFMCDEYGRKWLYATGEPMYVTMLQNRGHFVHHDKMVKK